MAQELSKPGEPGDTNRREASGAEVPTNGAEQGITFHAPESVPDEEPYHGLRWIFIGGEGLRAGWSALLALFLFLFFFLPISTAIMVRLQLFDGNLDKLEPVSAFFLEAASLIALIGSVALVGVIEQRRLVDYNLAGTHRPRHFLIGLSAGFLGISSLVAGLHAGGWLHLAQGELAGLAIPRYALMWGGVFLLTGCYEEGSFRCYLQFTLSRGISFWWALGTIAAVCAGLAAFVGGSASRGVYAAALLGLVACIILRMRSASHDGNQFWYAAWVTSTLFGAIHIANSGEGGIGILATACIGLVFCISLRVTGSAWWAIGCHAGWDWGETFFYGAADSGQSPHGSLFESGPLGNPFWSGGSVGPEGSVLVLGAILLLLALLLVYGWWAAPARPDSAIGSR